MYENDLQKVSKWVTLFWWWRPLGHLWRPSLFFDTKSGSKVLQKWPQGHKIDSKREAKVVKVTQKMSWIIKKASTPNILKKNIKKVIPTRVENAKSSIAGPIANLTKFDLITDSDG